MRNKRALRWGRRCAVLGFGIATLLAAFAYLLNSAHVHYDLHALFLILWPVSIGLMATDNAGVVAQVIGVAVLATMNAAIYFGIGFLAGLLPTSEGPHTGRH